MELILATTALLCGIFNILVVLNIITVNNKTDKYEKYRNSDGLLSNKKKV